MEKPIKNTITENSTYEEIKVFMIESKNIKEWNEKRELVKRFKNTAWIATHIDSSGLVIDCEF